jgi:hypothetical protein
MNSIELYITITALAFAAAGAAINLTTLPLP